MIDVRPAAAGDLPFLWEMLYQAIFVPPGEAPPGRDILALPSIGHYLSGFGRSGDFGLVALDNGRPIGAAWHRRLPADDPGYGFVADDIPELTIAVAPGWRASGVGTTLLRGLMEHAQGEGHRALSLSVQSENPARRLYARLGFVEIEVRDGALVMVRALGCGDAGGQDPVRVRHRLAYDRAVAGRSVVAKAGWKRAERTAFQSRLRAGGAGSLTDLGAGTGDDAAFFQAMGLAVTAVDLSPAMVAHMRSRGLRAVEGDLTRLPLPDGRLDAAWSLNAFLHLPRAQWDPALAEARRVLAPGGLMFLGVYGGRDSEAVFAQDRYRPRRLFTFHTDDALRERLERWGTLLDWHTVDVGQPDLHFQSATLCLAAAGSAPGAS